MGMRNIKTGLAVVICVFISNILKLEYSFYAAIAATITMETTVFNSFQAGKNRMLGTLVGATTGFICACILPGNALLCGIGIILVIYFCNLLKWKKSVSIACVVFMAIMVNLNGKNPLFYSLNRILDTFIGIIVAVIINYTICPPKYMEEIEKISSSISQCLVEFVSQEKFVIGEKELKDLDKNLKLLQSKIDIQENELKLNKGDNAKIEKVKNLKEIQLDIVNSLKLLRRLELKRDKEELSEDSKEELTLISNYNIREINNSIIALK